MILSRTVLLLGVMVVPACQPDRSRESTATAPAVAMPESVRAYLRQAEQVMNTFDSVRYMAAYRDTGDIVSVGAADITTNRDSLAATVSQSFRSWRTMKDFKIRLADPKIDVVGPAAAAVATTFEVSGQRANGKALHAAGAWSGVLAVENGRTVLVQEHTSTR